jgi:glycosyltransferase involved in cell wall biosynthesis
MPGGAQRNRSGAFAKCLRAAHLGAQLVRSLIRGDVDIVHLNCSESPAGVWRDLAFAAIAAAWRVPSIVHHHGSLPDVLARFPLGSRLGFRVLTRTAVLNIAMTRDSVRLLDGKGSKGAAAFLPNWIEDSWIDEPRESSAGKRNRPCTAVFVGRLSRDKGTLDLLRVALLLPDVRFLLIGSIGADVQDAIRHAPANVSCVGPMARMNILPRLLASDLFLFPSYREGFPYAVVEAMAAGLPIVATRVGAISELVKEGRGGHLAAPGDVPAMADAVRTLTDDRRLASRMGHYNRWMCRSTVAFPTVFSELSRLYGTVVLQRKGRCVNSVLAGRLPGLRQGGAG